MQRSRLAVNREHNLAKLEQMQATVEWRLRANFYSPAQADELFGLISGKIDIVTSEPEDNGQEFAHEAAGSEQTNA
jgi:hypothetical protein